MTLKDEQAWNRTVQANQDPYGKATVDFAERWASAMEVNIMAGAPLADIASTCERNADTEGVTGFMYGAAVAILAKVWVHGEDLRRWHNRRTQLGDEGDRANESGAVLNPAMLVFGGRCHD